MKCLGLPLKCYGVFGEWIGNGVRVEFGKGGAEEIDTLFGRCEMLKFWCLQSSEKVTEGGLKF